MNRRQFLGGSLGTFVASSMMAGKAGADEPSLASPRHVKLAVRPVMTNIVHTGVWEGPCRWRAVDVAKERSQAEAGFAGWSKQVAQRLGGLSGVELLPPVHVVFCEDFQLKPDQLRKLTADGKAADVLLVSPGGASAIACEVGKRLGKPIVLEWGLNCRTVDIAAYARSMGHEAFVPANEEELRRLLVALRARKVFSETSVLFPTDRGLPPVASVASVNDPEDLQRRYGIRVVQISYKELAAEMDRALADDAEQKKAGDIAEELVRGAQHAYLENKHVARTILFYRTVKRLMGRHGCNAFTIECFEFCSSRLPEKWQITPCLVHTLLKDAGHASSCEADLGALLSMRLLMSVSQKSSHLGNVFLRDGDTVAINHSAAGLKMNGFDQPGLPYKLGRFVESGWGTKAVVDFTNNDEKRVTVVRIDPTATRMLVLKGTLVGSVGWEGDNIGCSVEARIKPAEGRAEDFLRKQLDYGNHLIWVYGHYTEEMQMLARILGMDVEVVT